MGRYAKSKVNTHTDPSKAFADVDARQFPPVMTVAQAAEFLQISPSTVYHAKSEGRLEGTYSKVGNRLRFWRDALVRHLLENGI